MLPLAAAIAPGWRIIAPRGRIDQSGERRWFRKYTPISFDQDDIRREADAFRAFVETLAARRIVDLKCALFLGYSNGGNLVSSTMLLHPGLVRTAALLRTMPVLWPTPRVDLSGSNVIVVAGHDDETYGPHARGLAERLRRRGARVASRTVDAGHMPVEEDAALVRNWLRRALPPALRPAL